MSFSIVSIVILLLLIVGFVVILLFVFATRQTGDSQNRTNRKDLVSKVNPLNANFWGDNPEEKIKFINVAFLISLFLSLRIVIGDLSYYCGGSFSCIMGNIQLGPYLGPTILVTRVPVFYALILIFCFNKDIYPSSVLKSLLLLFALKLVYFTLVSLPYQLQYDEPYSFGSEYNVEIIYGESVLPEIMILLSLFSISLFLFFTIQIFRMKADFAGYVVAFIFSLILLNIITSYMWFQTILEPALNQNSWFFSISNIRFDLISETLMLTLFWYSMACFYSYRANIKPWITSESLLEEIELEARKQARREKARREKESGRGISAYAASQLKEAKGLLDSGVISEEEFMQIKGEYLGDQAVVDAPVAAIHDDRDTIIKDSVVSKSSVGAGGKSKAEQIREIKELLDTGAISEEDYQKMKREIVG